MPVKEGKVGKTISEAIAVTVILRLYIVCLDDRTKNVIYASELSFSNVAVCSALFTSILMCWIYKWV